MTIYSHVTSGSTSWYKTTYGGKWAYIPTSAIKIAAPAPTPVETYYNPYKTGTTSTAVPVRSSPSSSASVVTNFQSGRSMTIYSHVTSGSASWYKTTYGGKWAYLPTSAVSLTQAPNLTPVEFEAYMTAQGFPNSYKPYLRTLHQKHPTWTFNAQQTGVSWSTTLSKMNVLGRTLVEPTSKPSWKSTASGAYNASTGTYTQFDGRWNQASPAIISYYLDPRNGLNESSIYQFMDQRWIPGTAITDNIWNIVRKNSCFMNNKNYVYPLYYAGQNAGVNPTALTAMVILEQGWRGGSGLISGSFPGYQGYYNHFNVGAYHAGGMTSIQRGLWWAKGAGVGATSFGRPWNSIQRSLTGGATFYGNNYIKANQFTFYTKKFNVMNGASNVGLHQYSTSVTAADGEGKILKMGYATNNQNLVFWIPVYTGLPNNPAPMP